MACDSQYYALFNYYTDELEKIFTSDEEPYSTDRPMPVHEDVGDFLNDKLNKEKGLYVTDLRRYYQGELLNRIRTRHDYVSMFVIPEYGETQIETIQVIQNVVISFDSFVDTDPRGERQIKLIDWFIDKHREIFDSVTLGSGREIYLNMSTVSKPVFNQSDQSSAYVRRSIVINLRYCNCG